MIGYMLYYTEAMRPLAPERARDRNASGAASPARRKTRIVSSALTVAAVGALVATAAVAETARIESPHHTVTLNEGPLDVSASWTPLDDGAYEVTATFTGHGDAAPMRVVMRLAEGDDVSFSMPGHRGTLYRFTRDQVSVWPMRVQLADGVSVSARTATVQYASR
jgi:hypothetical protein